MSSHHHIGNIKFPSHTNGIQWILALPGTRTLVKLQQKQWFLLAFCKAATAAVIPPRLFNAMHDQRLNTGSCCYAETSEIKNVMQLRPYAHQDGIEHVCVVVCLPFSLDVGWRFDSSVSRSMLLFNRERTTPQRLKSYVRTFQTISNDVQLGSVVAFAAARTKCVIYLSSSCLLDVFSTRGLDWRTAGHGILEFDRIFCSSRVRVVQNFWDEIRFVRTIVLFTQ